MKRWQVSKLAIIGGLVALLMLGGSGVMAQTVARPEGWDETSHGNNADPDYAVVFPQDKVNTITITIGADNWAAMQADMTALYGEFGTRQNRMWRGGEGERPNFNGEPPEGGRFPGGQPPDFNGEPPEGGRFPDGNFMRRGFDVTGMFPDQNPMWVPVTLEFEGQTWTDVGMRFKGNSSLSGTWGAGNLKLPFKLDFDEFEDANPAIDNQRFYGFKQLSFSSNFRDNSYLHEKVAADLFREAGIPAAQTAFYAVYVDYGEGPVYVGLYTAVEVVDDTVIETQFADGSGNLYKPEGRGATFAEGTFDEASFEKETNEKAADYSDILALFDALHADTRTTDPAAWRAGLETVLDVDHFIHWLAVNTVIQNWDTYGTMSHNYYLYNDPSTGLLTWIPWDNNEALTGNGGFPGGRRGMGGATNNSLMSVSLEGVGSDWPLIRYLLDDPVYWSLYVRYTKDTITGAFEPSKMTETYERYHALITPYVLGDGADQAADMGLESISAFKNSLTELITHVNGRQKLVQTFIADQAEQ